MTRNLPDMQAVNADLKQLSMLQRKIWDEAVDATKQSSPAAQMAGPRDWLSAVIFTIVVSSAIYVFID